MGRGRQLEKLTSLSELGEVLGIDRRKAWRRVKAIYDLKPGAWLVRMSDRKATKRPMFRVNIPLLRHEHPELFDAQDPMDFKEDVDNLKRRVLLLERHDHAKGARLIALAREMREYATRIDAACKAVETCELQPPRRHAAIIRNLVKEMAGIVAKVDALAKVPQ